MENVDVLVVGGGPVGLIATLLFRQLGLSVKVVELRDGPQTAPSAHVVSARSLEILRSLGLDMDRIEALAQIPAEGAWVRWVDSLVGRELGHVPFENLHQPAVAIATSPQPLRNLSQHRLEPFLYEAVGDVTNGVAWLSAREDGDGVTSVLQDRASGEEFEVRSRYILGADGASSSVRKFAGIEMEGPDALENFISIHVEADLRSLVGHRPATLYWITDPTVQGTFVAHDIASTWVYMTTYDPSSETVADYDHVRAEAIVRRAGQIPSEIPLTVRHVSTWRMTSQVATSFRRGRIFLAGDSAHRFPPTGGLGLNTGIAEAHNLAWKLASVLRGASPESLLDSYESERRPLALANANISLENAMRLIEVWIALAVDGDLEASKSRIDEILATPQGRAAVAGAIENQSEHFDQLGVQLGYAYSSSGGLVVDDELGRPEPTNPVREYIPSCTPGARLPHLVIERSGEVLSTLDLVVPGEYLLLTTNAAWRDVVGDLTLALTCVVLGGDITIDKSAWHAVSAVGPNGAVLVRPDQHVAWRSNHGPTEHGRELETVLRALRAGEAS